MWKIFYNPLTLILTYYLLCSRMFLCNVKPSAAVAIFVSVAYLLQLSTQCRSGWIVMEREEELVNMTRSPLASLEIILNSGLRG